MTIDEIRQAKAEAEARILAEMQGSQERVEKELRELEKATGMRVMPPEVHYIDCSSVHGERRIFREVRLDLRVP